MINELLTMQVFRTVYSQDRAAWLDPDEARAITDDVLALLEPWLPTEEGQAAHARRTDPQTSHAAAAGLTPERLRVSQEAVLAVLTAFGPLHDEALVAVYREQTRQDPGLIWQSDSGIRTRRAELVRLGLVRDSGTKIQLVSGNFSIVWEAGG